VSLAKSVAHLLNCSTIKRTVHLAKCAHIWLNVHAFGQMICVSSIESTAPYVFIMLVVGQFGKFTDLLKLLHRTDRLADVIGL